MSRLRISPSSRPTRTAIGYALTFTCVHFVVSLSELFSLHVCVRQLREVAVLRPMLLLLPARPDVHGLDDLRGWLSNTVQRTNSDSKTPSKIPLTSGCCACVPH